MFVSIELENIGPYTKKVKYDFKINKKDKKNLDSTIELPDGVIISKIVGVIAGNASGKSTLIDALTSIGAFMDKPIKARKMPSVDELYKDNDSFPISKVSYEGYYDFVRNHNPLISVNRSNKNNVGTIKVEMYINTKNDYEGYYQYTVQYDSNVDLTGVLLEKLEYKRKYVNKYSIVFQTRSGVKESEIGSKLFSKQNWIVELESAGMDTKGFENRMNYYESFYKKYIEESSIMLFDYQVDEEDVADTIKEEKYLFLKALKMVDNSVVDVEVDAETDEKKVFINYGNYSLRYDYLSTATKKICDFLYNFVITSKNSGVLLSDEFDSSLNREVSKMLLSIYINSNIKKTGQFIFTAITPEIFEKLRRDQIFILTKENGIVDLTRYDEFRNPDNNQIVRNDFSFTKAYKNNIIKNYPYGNLINDFIKYLEDRI